MSKIYSHNDTHPVNCHVGKRIEQRMAELDLNLEEFALLSGLDVAETNRIIQGTARTDPSQLFNIAHVLHVSVNFFFEKYNDSKNKEIERLLKAFLSISSNSEREKYLQLIEGKNDDTSC